ncbi:MAG TPA: tetratricopeptide repeat protein [Bacteroidales bacterium]|nr:tetratricopeptide repeat protein [Bacteroidales bacterium]HRW84989.1 tetratricopeptide repeat protein [Bacteroidales bacterium]
MDTKKTIQQHKKICSLVSTRRIKQSLDILHDMILSVSSGHLRDEYEDLVMTYRNMLTYTIDGVEDPERERVYSKLIQSILELSDKVRQDILSHYSGWNTYWVKQQTEKEQKLTGKTLVENVDDLMFKSELDEWLKLSTEINPDPESEISVKHRQLIRNIFNHLWLTDYYGEAEESLLKIIFESGKFRWHESSIFTTAITLSLFRCWQTEKLTSLIRIYKLGEDKVMERALTGLILNLHYYNERILLYPEIVTAISKLGKNKHFREHCRIIVLQILRSRETEKLGKRLQDEILPQVAKLRPRIEDKLDLNNILPGEASEEKNPDWAGMFEDTEDIFKTMEELTNLQMEGADVYMSAFANLKHFDFFKDFQNWFMPFYPDHDIVNEIFRDEILGPGTNEMAEAMYKTPFICNSDKFSLILNLKYLPATQKNMMLKVFRMELEALGQYGDNESIADPTRNFRTNVTQYLQDIYRFFKLSPYKKEFEDIFSGRLDIYNSSFFRLTCNAAEAEAGLADYFFSKDFYEDALELYRKQVELKPDESRIYEKMGYCCQKLEDYGKALEYYRKAEIIERKPWTIKKIGLCLRRLDRTEEALDYYLEAGTFEPDNLHTAIMTAHCYLDLKEYEKALSHYFRVEYNDPGNINILRPIAYCYLALGKFTESERYFERLSSGGLSSHDLVNMGHLAFCKGLKKEAVEYYRQSILKGEITTEQFMAIFSEDMALLTDLGVNKDDIPIILDYILFSIG